MYLSFLTIASIHEISGIFLAHADITFDISAHQANFGKHEEKMPTTS
jgi:hypothetical protein